MRISPDGQWVVARESSQLYLIPAPSFGGEPPTVDLTSVAAPTEAQAKSEEKPKDSGEAKEKSDEEPPASATLPVKKFTAVGADSFAWGDNGSSITWGLGGSFFRGSVRRIGALRGRRSGTRSRGPCSRDT